MQTSRAFMGALLLVALAVCSPVALNGYVIRTASSMCLDNTYHDSALFQSLWRSTCEFLLQFVSCRHALLFLVMILYCCQFPTAQTG